LFFASVELPDAAPLRWGQLGAVGLSMSIAAWIASAIFATRAVDFAGGGRWFAISIAAFACALMSKGLTLVLPVLLLVIDAWPLRRLERSSKSVLIVEKMPLFTLLPIAAALAFWGQASARSAVVSWQTHTLVERTAQACYGLCFYPLRTLWPADLLPIYELPSDLSFTEPRFALSAVVVIATCAALFALRKRVPAAVATWIAFAVAIFPVIGFTQAGPQLVADRYSYLACMPFALFAAGAWLAWLRDRERARAAAGGVAFACVAALGVLTFRQTRTWHDTETMFERVIAVNPASPAGFAQMATYRSYQAQHAATDDERKRLLLEANDFFRRAFELDPHPFAPLLLNYGTNLLVLGRASEAVDLLRKFVAARPQSAMGATNLGLALGQSGQPAESMQWLQRAVAIDPNYATGWSQLASAYDRAGDATNAIKAYEQVVRLQPNNAQARERLNALKSRH
jgi:tetratricopeptide (TPR) repeat protein